jgi:hypothetical protein
MLFALFALFSVVSAQTATQCTQFCSDYTTTCMGLATANDIYTDAQACQDECMKFPMAANCPDGSSATDCATGNSYGCRRYHLNVAMDTTTAGNDVTHCPHTTPLSSPTSSITAADAVSGTVCKDTVVALNATGQNGLVADFCNQVTSACSAWLNTLDMAKCTSYYYWISGATDVANYPDGTNRKFPVAALTGNGLPCRRYHAQVARTSSANADEHCKHALFGADACGTPCTQLCQMGPAICPQSFDAATCMADCNDNTKVPAAVDPMYKVVTNRDIVCRLYHLAVASESAQLNTDHCPHASIASTADTCASGAATLSVSALFLAALALITKFSS